jgi:hypothetical protein
VAAKLAAMATARIPLRIRRGGNTSGTRFIGETTPTLKRFGVSSSIA